jgi:hypothetical protein
MIMDVVLISVLAYIIVTFVIKLYGVVRVAYLKRCNRLVDLERKLEDKLRHVLRGNFEFVILPLGNNRPYAYVYDPFVRVAVVNADKCTDEEMVIRAILHEFGHTFKRQKFLNEFRLFAVIFTVIYLADFVDSVLSSTLLLTFYVLMAIVSAIIYELVGWVMELDAHRTEDRLFSILTESSDVARSTF